MLEIEVKYFLGEKEAAHALCHRLGLDWQDGTFEVNRVFDYTDRRLQARGALVRVRERGESGWLTYKEKTAAAVPHAKVRLEYDTGVTDPRTTVQVLNRLGLIEVFRYERRRARHRVDDAHLEVDDLPGGWFCEIEASPEAIAQLIRRGGLESLRPIVWSYPEIFERLVVAGSAAATVWTFEAWQRGQVSVPVPESDFWSDADRE